VFFSVCAISLFLRWLNYTKEIWGFEKFFIYKEGESLPPAVLAGQLLGPNQRLIPFGSRAASAAKRKQTCYTP
jgi:hypothetical protein